MFRNLLDTDALAKQLLGSDRPMDRERALNRLFATPHFAKGLTRQREMINGRMRFVWVVLMKART